MTDPCYGPPRIGAIRFSFELIQPSTVSVIAKQHILTADDMTMMPADGGIGSSRRLRRLKNESLATKKSFIHGFGESAPEEDRVIPKLSSHPPTKLTDFEIAGSYDAEFLYDGSLTTKEMVWKLNAENDQLTWTLRMAGWFIMALSFLCLLNIDNVPIFLAGYGIFVVTLGDIVGMMACIADMCCDMGRVIEAIAFCIQFFFCAALALPPSIIIISLAWVFARPFIGIPLLLGGVLFMAGGVHWSKSRKKHSLDGNLPQRDYELVQPSVNNLGVGGKVQYSAASIHEIPDDTDTALR